MTSTKDLSAPSHVAASFLNKVPVVTATFWVIKILSTTIGETFADFLAVNVGLGPTVTDVAMMALLAATLVAQLRTRRYVPWLYWLTVVLVSIVGTQITDLFTDVLGVSLYVSTAVFAVVLSVVFVVWWRQERTLAITAIDTPRRERFYWAAILVTFALGTAGGDLATEALSLGFRNGVLLFGGLILAVWTARELGASSVLTFWLAYVLTRPLGAHGPLSITGRARDLRTDATGSAQVADAALLHVTVEGGVSTSVSMYPTPERASALVGHKVGAGWRTRVARQLRDHHDAGSVLHLLLDELPVGMIISGFTQRHLAPATTAQHTRRLDVCAGWAADSRARSAW